jgi:hypothetical protein
MLQESGVLQSGGQSHTRTPHWPCLSTALGQYGVTTDQQCILRRPISPRLLQVTTSVNITPAGKVSQPHISLCEVIPGLIPLSITPWRRVGNRRRDPHILDQATSFTLQPLYTREVLGNHWTGCWVGPTAVLDNAERKKIWPYRDSNSESTTVQPVASSYTECAISTPKFPLKLHLIQNISPVEDYLKSKVSFMFQSAYKLPSDLENALNAGFCEYKSQPYGMFWPDECSATVQWWVQYRLVNAPFSYQACSSSVVITCPSVRLSVMHWVFVSPVCRQSLWLTSH